MNSEIQPPYFAVIFTSLKKSEAADYFEIAKKMEELASTQIGFLGNESARENNGFGITVSYWKSLEDIARWKLQNDHLQAQKNGKSIWYSGYKVRICKVERQYHFGKMDFLFTKNYN